MGELLNESVQLAWAIAASTTVDQTLHNWNSQPLPVANTPQVVYVTPYSTTEGTYGTPQVQNQVANFKAPEIYGPGFAYVPCMPTLMCVGGPTCERQADALRGVCGKSSKCTGSSSSSDSKKEFASRTQKKKDVSEKKELGECSVCMDRVKSHALVPCGHLCACVECAAHLIKKKLPCPVCRGSIERSVQIYV